MFFLYKSPLRCERELAGPNEQRRIGKQHCLQPLSLHVLRQPLTTGTCFFCDKAAGYREQLPTVSTKSAGKSLHDAIEITGNNKLRVNLSTAVDLKDAHAIGIKYKKVLGK